MQRKPSFPIANCNIKMPESTPSCVEPIYDEETEQRRQQLINFGHSQWGFNNWSWSVTKQELDFVDFANGLHTAGVVTFVAVTVKSLDIHRENIGYATAAAAGKGAAIYRARKSGVSNALRETLLAFGGPLAAALQDMLAAARPAALPPPAAPVPPVPPQAPAVPLVAPSPARLPTPPVSAPPAVPVAPCPAAPPPERPRRAPEPAPPRAAPPVAAARPLPVAAALPMPAAGSGAAPLLPAPGGRAGPAARAPRPSNVSFVLQPVMGGVYGSRLPAPAFPGYYDWGYAREEAAPACWVKPTIFYDGFWTEHKLRRWLAEQLAPDDPRASPARPAP